MKFETLSAYSSCCVAMYLLLIMTPPLVTNSDHACKICNCTPFPDNTWAVECNRQDMESIPKGLPENTSSISLNANSLCNFSVDSFQGLHILQNLSASGIGGCSAVLFLQKGVFMELTSLKRLCLTFGDTPNCTARVPSDALVETPHLEYLEIDQLYLPLPSITVFLKLKHLRVSIKWCFRSFGNNMFENIPNLLRVDLSFNGDHANMSSNIFTGQNLKTLQDILLLSPPKRILKNIFLSLKNVTRLSSLTVATSDVSNFTSYIEDLLLLENTTVISLSFEYIDIYNFEFLQFVPRSIESLYLNHNCIELYRLISADLSWTFKLKTVIMDCQFCSCPHMTEYVHPQTQRNLTAKTSSIETLAFSGMTRRSQFNFGIFHFLQNVKRLIFSADGTILTIDDGLLASMPLLRYIDFNDNDKVIFSSTQGFSSTATEINLENSVILCDDCAHPHDLDRDPSVTYFENCSKLQYLNMANTGIQSISTDFFLPHPKLQVLNINTNKMIQFQSRLYNSADLKVLDLSSNNIRTITPDVVHDLELISKASKVRVNLKGNPLLCSCNSIRLLELIHYSNVIFESKGRYTCNFGNGTKKGFNQLHQWLPVFKQECKSYVGLIIGTTVAITAFLGTISAVLLYRYRWKLRYMFYRMKLSIPRKSIGDHYKRVFDYDAFVSYADEDRRIVHRELVENLETNNDLRLCIHARDFVPGNSVAENIARAVHSSKRTVIMMSKNFLASNWCMYEMNIARMEDIHDDRKVVIVVLLEDIPTSDFPLDVLDLIRTKTYLEYPSCEQDAGYHFWEKLAYNIKED